MSTITDDFYYSLCDVIIDWAGWIWPYKTFNFPRIMQWIEMKLCVKNWWNYCGCPRKGICWEIQLSQMILIDFRTSSHSFEAFEFEETCPLISWEHESSLRRRLAQIREKICWKFNVNYQEWFVMNFWTSCDYFALIVLNLSTTVL